MKKFVKNLTLFLLIALMLLTLASCKELDDMKSRQGFITEDESEIRLGEAVYYLLPGCEALKPAYTDSINVTASDVPVLLSAIIGYGYDLSSDGIFLERSGTVYCRSDYFEKVKNSIETGYSMTSYCFLKSEYKNGMYEQNYKVIAPAVGTILENAIEKGTPFTIPGSGMRNERIYEVYHCSGDTFFKSYAFDIRVSGNACYVTVSDLSANETIYYPIADTDTETILRTLGLH